MRISAVPVLMSLVVLMLAIAASTAAPQEMQQMQEEEEHHQPHQQQGTSGEDSNGLVPTKVCHNSTPCGWAVYSPSTREEIYFVKNTCDCPIGRRCNRAEDDLSVRAHVFRCTPHEVTTAANAAAPTTPSSGR